MLEKVNLVGIKTFYIVLRLALCSVPAKFADASPEIPFSGFRQFRSFRLDLDFCQIRCSVLSSRVKHFYYEHFICDTEDNEVLRYFSNRKRGILKIPRESDSLLRTSRRFKTIPLFFHKFCVLLSQSSGNFGRLKSIPRSENLRPAKSVNFAQLFLFDINTVLATAAQNAHYFPHVMLFDF